MTRSQLAGTPDRPVELPAGLRELVGGRLYEVLWRNELGGLTVAVNEPEPLVLKWAPPAQRPELVAEADRMAWAGRSIRVPEVVDVVTDDPDGGAVLVTRRLAGWSVVDRRWHDDPSAVVRALGVGLRTLHDSLPVDECPWRWSLDDRRQSARRRAAAGRIAPARWDPRHRDLGVDEALAIVDRIPDGQQPVVCHGDACAPNTLVDDAGTFAAHVDLGRLGVGERWADLAVAAWSTEWNFGPGWSDAVVDAYGIEPDPELMAAYRLLWDLGD